MIKMEVYNKKNSTKISEAELAKQVMCLLTKNGWDCYPEAQLRYGNGRADIAALKDGSLWIIETKTTLSMRLLEQARDWVQTRAVNRVTVVSPTKSISNFVEEICQWKGIGVIAWNKLHKTEHIHHYIEPKSLDFSQTRLEKMLDSLHPDMKNYSPGTTTNNGYSTPYNRTMKAIREFLLEHPGSTIKEVANTVKHHYASNTTAQICILKGAMRGGVERIRAEKIGNKWSLYAIQ